MNKRHTETVWGKDQIPFYDDGTLNDESGNRVAMGVINTSSTPSTIYSFGYPESLKVLGKLIGKHGVNTDSLVICNTSRKALGIVDSLRNGK